MLITTLGTLLLLGTSLALVATIITLGAALVTRRTQVAWRAGVVMLAWLVAYLALMVCVSLLTPQTVLDLGQEHCFDEMCFSATQVVVTTTLGSAPNVVAARGIYYVVTVQLRNVSLRTAQKPDSPAIYLVDQRGQRYSNASSVQRALGPGPMWSQQLLPGAIQARQMAFDVPPAIQQPRLVITEGGWPSYLVIGDENSLLHQKTEIRLVPIVDLAEQHTPAGCMAVTVHRRV